MVREIKNPQTGKIEGFELCHSGDKLFETAIRKDEREKIIKRIRSFLEKEENKINSMKEEDISNCCKSFGIMEVSIIEENLEEGMIK